MNNRIKELADQASELATTRHPVSNIVLSINPDLFERKFAELIIKECIEQIDEVSTGDYGRDEWDKGYDAGLMQASETIKEHFGVE